jgi:hypothetical protein
VKVLSALLALSLTAHAADPGAAAIAFLEKARTQQLRMNSGGDTAISPQTVPEKRQAITERLRQLAAKMSSTPFELGPIRQDGDYAAVLVRQLGEVGTEHDQIFPVALIKRGESWIPAPIPASFDNTGIASNLVEQARLTQLENWMLREQITDLETLRTQSLASLREKISQHLSAADLRKMTARQAAERFLTACENQDALSLLGLMGGLASQPSSDWPLYQKAATKAAISADDRNSPWQLLSSPAIARIIVNHEDTKDGSRTRIVCLDPTGNSSENGEISSFERVSLEISKTKEGLWLVTPPHHFLNGERHRDATTNGHDATSFAAAWQASQPSTAFTSPELAQQELIRAIASNNFRELLKLISFDSLNGDNEQRCFVAAQTWHDAHSKSTAYQFIPLAQNVIQSTAVCLSQAFSPRDPSKFNERLFYFEVTPNGWLWVPKPGLQTFEKHQAWTDAETLAWPEKWQQRVLADCVTLTEIGTLPPPSPDAAKQLIESWITASRANDFQALSRLTAKLNTPSSSAVALQRMGYELTDAQSSTVLPKISKTYSSGTWAAVGVACTQKDRTTYPLYPIVQTPAGPRVLIETDLYASPDRVRNFLNKASLDRLEKATNPAVATELRELLSQHQRDSGLEKR